MTTAIMKMQPHHSTVTPSQLQPHHATATSYSALYLGQGSCSGHDLWKTCRQTGDIQDIHHMHTYTHAVCTMFATILCAIEITIAQLQHANQWLQRAVAQLQLVKL